jgi:hypothetical protein
MFTEPQLSHDSSHLVLNTDVVIPLRLPFFEDPRDA